jgi:hypothetical protein
MLPNLPPGGKLFHEPRPLTRTELVDFFSRLPFPPEYQRKLFEEVILKEGSIQDTPEDEAKHEQLLRDMDQNERERATREAAAQPRVIGLPDGTPVSVSGMDDEPDEVKCR